MKLETKDILLRPISESDLQILHAWRNTDSYMSLFVNRRNLASFEEFKFEFKKDLERQRHVQFLIVFKKTGEPIGLIYSYNANMIDGYVFMGTYIDDRFQRRGYGALATILFIKHLFDVYPIQKICLDIFSYNTASISGSVNLGFAKEGEFIRQRFWFGKYWNIIRLALFREDTTKIDSLYEKLIRIR
jgi:RimJ/RimL family protein N-acetyltransferase